MLGEQLSVQGVWGSLLSPFQSFSALPQPPAALLSLLVALTQTCPVFLKEGGCSRALLTARGVPATLLPR